MKEQIIDIKINKSSMSFTTLYELCIQPLIYNGYTMTVVDNNSEYCIRAVIDGNE